MACGTCGIPFLDNLCYTRTIVSSWNLIGRGGGPTNISISEAFSTIFEVPPLSGHNQGNVFTDEALSLCFGCAESLTILYNSYKEFTTQVIKLESEVAHKLQRLLHKEAPKGEAAVQTEEEDDKPKKKKKKKEPEIKEEVPSGPECCSDFDDYAQFSPLGIANVLEENENKDIKEEEEGERSLRPRRATRPKFFAIELDDENEEDNFFDPAAVLQKLEVDWQEEGEEEDDDGSDEDVVFSSDDDDDDGSSSESDSDQEFCLTPIKNRAQRKGKSSATRRERRTVAPAVKTSSGKFQCPDCDKVFAHRKSYTRHYRTHTEFASSIQCPTCDKMFTREDHLKVHRRKIHGEDIPVKNLALFKNSKEDTSTLKRYECPVCSESVLKREMPKHLENHNDPKPWKCKECSQGFTSKKHLSRHVTNLHGLLTSKVSCSVCSKNLRSEYHLTRHQAQVHHVRTDRSASSSLQDRLDFDPLSCEQCGKQYATKNKLQEHMIVHGVGEKFKCGVCGAEFNHKKSHQRHVMKHSEASLYKCPEEGCKKKFVRKDNLAVHIREVHKVEVNYGDLVQEEGTGEKPVEVRKRGLPKKIPCSDCGKLVVRGNMKLHMVKHTGERTHLCDICGRSFGLHTSLVTHRKYTHQLVAPLKCGLCGKVCRRPKDYRAHMHLHELGDQRPFVCEICGKTFRHEKNLKSHHAVHEAHKEYPCKVCGATFNRTDNLRAHVRVVHEGKPARRRKPKNQQQQPPTLLPLPPPLLEAPSFSRQLPYNIHRRGEQNNAKDEASMSSIASSESSQVFSHRIPTHMMPIMPGIQYHSHNNSAGGAYSNISSGNEYPHNLLHL